MVIDQVCTRFWCCGEYGIRNFNTNCRSYKYITPHHQGKRTLAFCSHQRGKMGGVCGALPHKLPRITHFKGMGH